MKENNAKKEAMARYEQNIADVDDLIKQLTFTETDDPNVLCARLVKMSSIISRAMVLVSYFNAVYEKSYMTLKAEAGKRFGERIADAHAKGQFADLKEIKEKAEGIITAIERISANYKAVLDWKEAELNQFGKRG